MTPPDPTKAAFEALATDLNMYQRHRLRGTEDGWQFGERWLPPKLALDSGVLSKTGWRETYRLTRLGLELRDYLIAELNSRGREG